MKTCAPGAALRFAASALALLALLLVTRHADAYPFMIRHDYTACAMCHADPSGGGVLTPYGRAQGDLLLRTRYSGGAPEEADRSAGFLWGVFDMPDWLLAGGTVRTLNLWDKADGYPTRSSFFLLQADLRAEARIAGFRANGSIGAIPTSNSPAAISGSVVSREHWLGYGFGDDAFLVRAGRIDLPYGVRMIEHTMFVRAATRTDLNETQQHGVAFAYTASTVRGELMAIAGNYQIRPDAFRERGYSGYVEWAPLPRLAVGVSSLVTHAAQDVYLKVPSTRQAHGLFVRAAPVRPLVIMAEGDLLLQAPSGLPNRTGVASLLQADWEITQGVHLLVTGEHQKPQAGELPSYHGWFSANWFFAPHADVRFDVLRASDGAFGMRFDSTAAMLQAHVFL
jgi:hypothetical protein